MLLNRRKRNPLHLCARGRKFRGPIVVDTGLEGERISSLVSPFTAMIKGKPNFSTIGAVERG